MKLLSSCTSWSIAGQAGCTQPIPPIRKPPPNPPLIINLFYILSQLGLLWRVTQHSAESINSHLHYQRAHELQPKLLTHSNQLPALLLLLHLPATPYRSSRYWLYHLRFRTSAIQQLFFSKPQLIRNNHYGGLYARHSPWESAQT